MSRTNKSVVVILGILTACGIVAQLVLARLIRSDPGSIGFRKAHEHSGYLVVVLVLSYVVVSLIAVVKTPGKRE